MPFFFFFFFFFFLFLFLFFFYSRRPVDEQKADCTFDYIDVWKKMKADSVNI